MILGQTGFEPSESADDDGGFGDTAPQARYPGKPSRVKSSVQGEGKSKSAEDRQAGFENAANELDDLVTGMNMFVADTSAGPDGAEVETVAGDVQFDVDKFMSLLNGADLR